MDTLKNPQKKVLKNKDFSAGDKIVLYFKGEAKEFKSTTDFVKQTKISGAIVKDWFYGYLEDNYKGWHIDKFKSMDQELQQPPLSKD